VWISTASKVPRNGNSEPPPASVTAVPPEVLDGDVGALGASPPHAAAKRQKLSTAYRIVLQPFSEESANSLDSVRPCGRRSIAAPERFPGREMFVRALHSGASESS
jgi:hypothetical protein